MGRPLCVCKPVLNYNTNRIAIVPAHPRRNIKLNVLALSPKRLLELFRCFKLLVFVQFRFSWISAGYKMVAMLVSAVNRAHDGVIAYETFRSYYSTTNDKVNNTFKAGKLLNV